MKPAPWRATIEHHVRRCLWKANECFMLLLIPFICNAKGDLFSRPNLSTAGEPFFAEHGVIIIIIIIDTNEKNTWISTTRCWYHRRWLGRSSNGLLYIATRTPINPKFDDLGSTSRWTGWSFRRRRRVCTCACSWKQTIVLIGKKRKDASLSMILSTNIC